MPLAAFIAFAALSASPPKAVLVSPGPTMYVKLHLNGRNLTVPEIEDFDIERRGIRNLKPVLKFKGKTYQRKSGFLVDSDGKQIQKLDAGRFDNIVNGVAVKEAMYWLATVWTDTELGTSFPIVSSHLYTMKEDAGSVKVVKDTDLMPLVIAGQMDLAATIYGNYLRLGGMLGNYALLNMTTGQIVKMPMPTSGERPERLVSDAAISTSGRIFWQEDAVLKQFDWLSETWKPIRRLSASIRNGWNEDNQWGKLSRPHDWLGALQIGDDDLLIATDIVAFAKKKTESAVPQDAVDLESPVRVFYLPNVGIGLVWGFEEFHVKPKGKRGVFYSLPSLKPLCRIKWPY